MQKLVAYIRDFTVTQRIAIFGAIVTCTSIFTTFWLLPLYIATLLGCVKLSRVFLLRKTCLQSQSLIKILQMVDNIEEFWSGVFGAADQDRINKLKYENVSHVNNEISTFLDLVIRDFVYSWYHTFSKDQECMDSVHELIEEITLSIKDRLEKLNIDQVVKLYIDLYRQHLAKYQIAVLLYKKQPTFNRKSDPKAQNKKLKSIIHAFESKYKFHIALVDRENEIDYIRSIVQMIFTILLPHDLQSCTAGRKLLEEILTCNVMLPLVEMLSQPDELNQIVIKILSDDKEQNKEQISIESSVSTLESELPTNDKEEDSLSVKPSQENVNDISDTQTIPCVQLNSKQEDDAISTELPDNVKNQQFNTPNTLEANATEGNKEFVTDTFKRKYLSPADLKEKEQNGITQGKSVSMQQNQIPSINVETISKNVTYNDNEQLNVDEAEDAVDALDAINAPVVPSVPMIPIGASTPVLATNIPMSSSPKSDILPSHVARKPVFDTVSLSSSEESFDAQHIDPYIGPSPFHSQRPSGLFPVDSTEGLSSQDARRSVLTWNTDIAESKSSMQDTSETKDFTPRGSQQIQIYPNSDSGSPESRSLTRIPTSELDNSPSPDLHSGALKSFFSSIGISSTEVMNEYRSKGTYVLYIIEYQAFYSNPEGAPILCKRIVRRRYREFVNLQERLEGKPYFKNSLKDVKGPSRWASMPFGKMDQRSVEGRRKKLEKYLQTIAEKEDLGSCEDFKEFLAYEGGANIAFVKRAQEISVPRIDKMFTKTVSGVFDRITTALPSMPQDSLTKVISRDRRKNRKTKEIDRGFDVDDIFVDYEFEDEEEEQEENIEESAILGTMQRFIQQSTIHKQEEHIGVDTPELSSISDDFEECIDDELPLLARRSEGDGCDGITSHQDATKTVDRDIPLASSLLNLAVQTSLGNDAWVCRENIIKSLKALLGKAINCWFQGELKDLTSKERCAYYIWLLRDTLWPNGCLATESAPERTQQEREQTVLDTRKCLVEFFPNFIPAIVGDNDFQYCVDQVLNSLQHDKLNRHFVYCLLDILVEEVFPEISTIQLQKAMLQQSKSK
ncbi:unnamed protein product [Owenia fusiformis]|uniref:Sorting nexin-19 n=1 Tax=Owenia fusiformis TaxID=6347 RepID=A0A8S4N0T0_OWEFU|nr:unnamed protein product [Owenia fusiformis]